MVSTVKLSPRIDPEWKECFDRHVDRVNSTLGDEVERALKNWLATYYLIHDDAREELPEEDRELIEKAIAKQTYEIENAYEGLNARHEWEDILEDLKNHIDLDELTQGTQDAVHESEN